MVSAGPDTIDHAALERAAREATQGEWRREEPATHLVRSAGGRDLLLADPSFHCGVEQGDANAAYIVAAQPSVILALLEERKRLAERVQRLAGDYKRVLLRMLAAEAERDRMRKALRVLVLDARPANWNDGDDENAECAWRLADAALAEKEPKP